MAANDVWKITMVGQLHGQETNNVWHFRFNSDAATFANLAIAIFDCIRTALLPGLSNEWRCIELRGKQLFPVATDEAIIPAEATDIGAINGEGLPSYCAGLISIKTGVAGRRNRGRFYIAGIPETGQTASRLTNGELALLVAFATCLANKFVIPNNNFPMRLGVLSRKNVQGGQNIGAAFREATVLTTTNVLATMRRRKLGVGS